MNPTAAAVNETLAELERLDHPRTIARERVQAFLAKRLTNDESAKLELATIREVFRAEHFKRVRDAREVMEMR